MRVTVGFLLGSVLGLACGDDTEPMASGTGDASDGTTAASSASSGEPTTSADTTEGDSSTGAVSATVSLQLLALNDFHGHLEPPQEGPASEIWDGRQFVVTGGFSYLADDIARLRGEAEHTLVVAAGDMIGASPLTSGLLHDEPTIEALNMIGLDVAGVGNHEFDDGIAELLRMQEGGCHPETGCEAFDPFTGAEFTFLAANTFYSGTEDTVFPGVSVQDVDGVPVAFIGMTLEGTGEIVLASSVDGLEFRDEVETVDSLVPQLQAEGVEAFVVLLHEGLVQAGNHEACAAPGGAALTITEALPAAVDVVVSGHSHQAYVCDVDGTLLTSGASFGRLVTDIDLEIDRESGDVVSAVARNVLVERDDVDAEAETFVGDMVELVAPIANAVVGTITEDIVSEAGVAGTSPLGRLVADAQLAAVADAGLGGAQLALMNRGGLRADLVFAASGEEAIDGEVSFAEIFAVHPFGNSVTTMTLTGAQLKTVLESQFQRDANRILEVSAGFTYSYSLSGPIGDKVDAASMMLDGAVIGADDEVRVAINDFIGTGGGPFMGFEAGANVLGGPVDVDALAAYFEQGSPLSPPAPGRVMVVP
ncbi:MAG: 5'-nucleotidase C-terminal domain-containing protein [Myxococcota bacterium]